MLLASQVKDEKSVKPRNALTEIEVSELRRHLERKLDHVSIETQPKVAVRMLQLAQMAEVQLSDYEAVIRTDSALTGRLLRLANSAYYAQRTPVTRLQRALALMGLKRVRAVSLGFYLSRAAAGAAQREISRRLWGQSVYRACLCSSLAAIRTPELSPEAFLIGLMLDCAVPLMVRLEGKPYEELLAQDLSPTKMYAAECATLRYTHVDVACAMVQRWRLPELLAHPIIMHHTPPPPGAGGGVDEPLASLRQVAFYTGAVALSGSEFDPPRLPLPSVASRVLRLGPDELEQAVRAAASEYAAVSSLFADLAESLCDVDELADCVHRQLVGLMDDQIEQGFRAEAQAAPQRFVISGQEIEVEARQRGEVAAYINDQRGQRLLSCTLRPGQESGHSLRRLLGLEEASEQDINELLMNMRRMAA